MTEHVFEGKPVKTYGDMGAIVAEIARAGDRARAKRFLDSYRAFCDAETGKPGNADVNIGYWTGYFDHDLAVKARAVFGVRHPYFPDDVTPEEAFMSGQAAGRGENPRVDASSSEVGRDQA